jgi:hypothetical protein
MVLAIRLLFKVEYCFTVMSYDGLAYYLLFKKATYSLEDHSVNYNNAVRPVVWEGWQFEHMWEA